MLNEFENVRPAPCEHCMTVSLSLPTIATLLAPLTAVIVVLAGRVYGTSLRTATMVVSLLLKRTRRPIMASWRLSQAKLAPSVQHELLETPFRLTYITLEYDDTSVLIRNAIMKAVHVDNTEISILHSSSYANEPRPLPLFQMIISVQIFRKEDLAIAFVLIIETLPKILFIKHTAVVW